MERLNWHMADELSRHFDVHIIAPAGAKTSPPKGVTVSDVQLSPLWRFLLRTTWLSLQIARHERPAVILAGSGLTAPIAWLAGRIARARTATYIHGLDVVAPSRIYRWIWLPLLRRIHLVIANSRATAALAENSGVPGDRVRIINPGVKLPELDKNASHRFRIKHRLDNNPLLLSVGRLTARKGLREFVSEVLPRIVKASPGTMLLIVGDVPTHALFAEAQTPASIRAAAQSAGVAQNVKFLGGISETELAEAYQSANVLIFPIRELPGDIEGFGMVAIEAAAYGLATVAYAIGGVTDAVCPGVSGYLAKPGDTDEFADSVLNILRAPLDREAMRTYAEEFAWPIFGQKLYTVIIEGKDLETQ